MILLPERYQSPTILNTEPDDALDGETQAIEAVLEAADYLVLHVGKKRALHMIYQMADALR